MAYKQPVTRKLPSGYADTTDYLNLSGIKGLRIVDNPLAAEQNSTYDCENVYVDDFGNLTVRPALKQTYIIPHNDFKQLVVTSIGEFQIYATQIFKAGVSVLQFPAGSSAKIIDDASQVYAVVCDTTKTQLYKFNGSKFKVTSGTIPISSSTELTLDDYNILNTDISIIDMSLRSALALTPVPLSIFVPKYLDDPFNGIIKASINGYSIAEVYDEYENYLEVRHDNASYKLSNWNGLSAALFSDKVIYNGNTTTDAGQNILKASVYSFDENKNTTTVYYWKDVSAGTINYATNIFFGNNGESAVACSELALYILSSDATKVPILIDLSGSKRQVLIDVSTKYILCYSTTDAELLIYNYAGELRASIPLDIAAYPRIAKIIGEYLIFSAPQSSIYTCMNISTGWATDIEIFDNIKFIDYNNTPVIFLENSASTQYQIYNDKVYLFDTVAVIADIPNMLENTNSTITSTGARAILRVGALDFKRPTNIIPVLSDITDNIITVFRLGSVWWIVTANHIFGTGVDNNTGFPTVEYWDPAKYFKVSETITGAIRVSDTSFWVFHANGAYLIYKTDDGLWGITNTPASKGCDFVNALTTLPVTNYIASVTASDISVVQLRENVQSDDRSLVPITLPIRGLISNLLKQTTSVVIGTFGYLTLFALNGVSTTNTAVIVYDNATNNWWLWTFPVNEILQFIRDIQTDEVRVICKKLTKTIECILTTDLYNYSATVGAGVSPVVEEIYADLFFNEAGRLQPEQITWSWESAILLFKSLNYRKQLMQTIFTLDDANVTDPVADTTTMNFRYKFKTYQRRYTAQPEHSSELTVTRTQNLTANTRLASFTFLQIVLSNDSTDEDDDNREYMTKPKIASMTFKYRTLTGGLS